MFILQLCELAILLPILEQIGNTIFQYWKTETLLRPKPLERKMRDFELLK